MLWSLPPKTWLSCSKCLHVLFVPLTCILVAAASAGSFCVPGHSEDVPPLLDSRETWNALLWHFLCWHSPRYLEPAGSSQRPRLAPVRPHPLSPHTSFCPAFSCTPPSVPSNLLSTWAPEAMSAPPVVHTTHEPPTGTSCGRFALRTREFLPHQTWPWAQCPVFYGNSVLCAVLPITSFVLILQLNPRL